MGIGTSRIFSPFNGRLGLLYVRECKGECVWRRLSAKHKKMPPRAGNCHFFHLMPDVEENWLFLIERVVFGIIKFIKESLFYTTKSYPCIVNSSK